MRSTKEVLLRFLNSASEERKDRVTARIERELEEIGVVRDAQRFALKFEEEMIENYFYTEEELIEDLNN